MNISGIIFNKHNIIINFTEKQLDSDIEPTLPVAKIDMIEDIKPATKLNYTPIDAVYKENYDDIIETANDIINTTERTKRKYVKKLKNDLIII